MCTISFVLANMGAVKNNVFLYKDVHSRKNHRARKTVAMLLLNQNRINECRECDECDECDGCECEHRDGSFLEGT